MSSTCEHICLASQLSASSWLASGADAEVLLTLRSKAIPVAQSFAVICDAYCDALPGEAATGRSELRRSSSHTSD